MKQIIFSTKTVWAGLAVFIAFAVVWFSFFDTNAQYEVIFGVDDTDKYINADRGGIGIDDEDVGIDFSVLQQNQDYSFRTLLRPQGEIQLRTHRPYPNALKDLTITTEIEPTTVPLALEIPCEDCEEDIRPLTMYVPGVESLNRAELEDGVYAYVPNGLYENERITYQELAATSVAQAVPVYLAPDVAGSIDMTPFAKTDVAGSSRAETIIETALSPNQELYVAVEDRLEVQFIKESRNEKRGSDAVTIALKSIAGERVNQFRVDDDGITGGNNVVNRTEHNLTFEVDQPGVYLLEIVPIHITDFSLHDVTLNTDQVVFTEGVFYQDAAIFTQDDSNGRATVDHKGNVRGTIESRHLSGTRIDSTTENLLGVEETIALADEGVSVITSAERFSVSDGVYAFTEDSWFDPYAVDVRDAWTADEQMIVLTGSDISLDAGSQHVRVQAGWTKEDLAPISAVDVAKPQRIRTRLRAVMDDRTPEEQYILQRYDDFATVCGIDIVTRLKTSTLAGETIDGTNADCREPALAALDAIPSSYGIYLGEYAADVASYSEFFEYDNLVQAEMEHEFRVRGNAQYALVAENGLDITIEKKDLNRVAGSDEVTVKLTDVAGNVIAKSFIDDDGDILGTNTMTSGNTATISVDNISGVYYVEVQSVKDDSHLDFFITTITANTNLVQAVGAKRFVGPVDLYMHLDAQRDQSFSINKKQVVDQFALYSITRKLDIIPTIGSDGKSVRYSLEPGEYSISIPSTLARTQETVVATHPEGFFTLPGVSQGVDVALMSDFTIPEIVLYSYEADIDYSVSLARMFALIGKGGILFILVIIKLRWEQWFTAIRKKNAQLVGFLQGSSAVVALAAFVVWTDQFAEWYTIGAYSDERYRFILYVALAATAFSLLMTRLFKESDEK